MAIRTMGRIDFINWTPKHFLIKDAEPHICIRLKAIFPKLNKAAVDEFSFPHSDENCHELLWFMQRHPLECDQPTMAKLKRGSKNYLKTLAELESIISGALPPKVVQLNEGYKARKYQDVASEVMLHSRRMILGDELGLGKSLTLLLCLIKERRTLPALIVVQTHMVYQWKQEVIEKFSNLKAHIIHGWTTYKLPAADVYIINYSCLTKWISVLHSIINSVAFDECQELRTGIRDDGKSSEKYLAAKNICARVKYSWGLSGSPIYNYGIEIYNILDCLKEGSVGLKSDFRREWCDYGTIVHEPKALGTYLREQFLMLRRTAAEVGRELPQINTVIQTVDYDSSEVEKSEDLARELANSYLTETNFMEKGKLARELDSRLRQLTGIAKAKEVAALVRILLENNEPVLLSGWHRAVYDIWLKELEEFRPVMFTGSESIKVKNEAKKKFIQGDTNLFIISNRSGVGLDGLQHRCRYVVIGELDWSPKVHDQIVGRVNRDGQQDQVTVIYPICNYGSDEVIVTVLGIKADQSHSIVDPHLGVHKQYTDENRIKLLAESYLKKHKK